jgi:hypothetical protein
MFLTDIHVLPHISSLVFAVVELGVLATIEVIVAAVPLTRISAVLGVISTAVLMCGRGRRGASMRMGAFAALLVVVHFGIFDILGTVVVGVVGENVTILVGMLSSR